MVDSPREIIGAVLKYMGGSYNTNDINKEIPGGISAVKQQLAVLAKQVSLLRMKMENNTVPMFFVN